MEKRQNFITAMDVYVDRRNAEHFFWTCSTGAHQGSKFCIKCNKVSWRGEIEIPSITGKKWKKITGSYYVKKDSISKAINFFKKYK